MALANKEITSTGQASQDLSFDFDYLAKDDIKVFVDGVEKTRPTDWDFLDSNTIDFVTHPANGEVIRIERQTPAATRNVDFQDGSVLSEADLDNSARQIFFVAQEASDTANDAVRVSADGTIDAQNRRVKNVAAPTANTDAVNLGYLSTSISSIQTVENNLSDIQTVENNLTDINSLATNMADINSVEDNLTELNAILDRYKVSATQPSAPANGDIWYNTTNSTLYIFDGTNFIQQFGYSDQTIRVNEYTATASQTAFTGSDDNSNTLNIVSGATTFVYLNGILLEETTDYTLTTSTNTLTLTTGATVNDELKIYQFNPFSTADYNTLVASKDTAVDSAADAEKLAIEAEDSQFTLSDGTTTDFSAKHYNAKAQAAKTAAETAETQAEGFRDTAETYKNQAENAKNDSETARNQSQTARDTAQEWASSTSSQVASTDYSAKEYAIGTQIRGTVGSAKDWATLTGQTVDGTEYSAKKYAQDAEASANTANSPWSTITGTTNVEYTNGYVTADFVPSNYSAAPSNPVLGQMYTDTTDNFVYHWNGSKWLTMSNAFVVSGGNTTGTYTSGGKTYKYHKFTSSGTLEVTGSAGNVEYVVVAGGGGVSSGAGSAGGAGGGGAGGYRSNVSGESSGGGATNEGAMTLTAGTYSITIGAGGTGSSRSDGGGDGGNSTFNGVTATGGGGGGQSSSYGGGSGGGQGVGSNAPTGNYGSGTSGQGYRGGSASGDQTGGGGGAGEIGNTDGQMHGGDGVQTSIEGTATYYAGGGAGQDVSSEAGGTAGAGGGGAARAHGSANTGGGAGGHAPNSYTDNGGSGVVIIRYEI